MSTNLIYSEVGPVFSTYHNNFNNDFKKENFDEGRLLNMSISVAKEASPQRDISNLNGYGNISDYETRNAINGIQKKILIFANILSQIDLFKQEYYMVMSIHNMFDYIFKNQDLLDSNFEFLMIATKDFFDVFDFKIENISKINHDKNVLKEYKLLSMNFSKTQRYFYNEIYESNNDKEFVDDMIKTLMG